MEQARDGRGGLPGQRAAIERVVQYEGLTVIRQFEILDTSGSNVFFSPEMREICDMVRRGEIGGLVASELDRIVRPTEFSELGKLAVFQEHNCVFYYEGGKNCLGETQDYVMSLFRLAGAASEKGLIKERTMRGKEALRRQGRWPNSLTLLPRGICYDRKTKLFSIDQAAIFPIVEAFRIIDEEGNAHIDEIAKRVGLKRTGLRNTLQNPIYKGVLSFRTKRSGKHYEGTDGRQTQRRKVPRAPEEQYPTLILYPPPVSAQRWDNVQTLLRESHRRWTEMRTRVSGVVFLLKGIGCCDHCGERLVGVAHKGRGNGKTKSYYYCWSNHQRSRKPDSVPRCEMKPIRRADLEETLVRFTEERLTNEKFLQTLVRHALESRRQRDLSGLSKDQFLKEKNQLEGRQKKLLKLCLDGVIGDSEFTEERSAISRQLAALEQRREVAREISTEDVCRFVLGIVRGAFAFRRVQDEEQRKQIIDQMFSRVAIRGASIAGFQLHPRFAAVDSSVSFSADGGNKDNRPRMGA